MVGMETQRPTYFTAGRFGTINDEKKDSMGVEIVRIDSRVSNVVKYCMASGEVGAFLRTLNAYDKYS